jgi:cytochrome c biogenesis protein CcmG/thiol:disulfide interchange protein DsbE
MSRDLRMGFLLAIGILLMGGSAYLVWRTRSAVRPSEAADPPVIRFASNPEPAPQLVVHELSGKITTMEQLRGKVVLVNFWATWCPPCRVEIPDFIKLQEKHGDRLQIIGVSEDDDPAQVQEFVKRMGINYPVVMATPELIAAYGGVAALPTTFVVDTEGRVVQKHLGLYSPEAYDREIRALTGLPVEARIEHFEDIGQIFSKNVAKATELPDVDFTGLSPEQKKLALRRLNSESCVCGCGLTLARCRVDDTTCPVSKAMAATVVKEVLEGKPAPGPSAVAAPAAP